MDPRRLLRAGTPIEVAVLAVMALVSDVGCLLVAAHAAGDHLLVEIAGAWSASLRPGDLLACFGGDEFILMLVGATAEQVDAILARLAAAHPAAWTAGTVLCSSEEPLEDAINRADARLYAAKESRRRAAKRGPQASLVPAWQLGRV